MAWSTPPSKSTGDTVSAADWQKIVDDLLETLAAKATTKGDLLIASAANTVARVAALGVTGSILIEDTAAATGWKSQRQQAVRANRSATQTITASTATAIALTAADDFDTGTAAMHDIVTNNTRLTAPVKGIYHVTGEVQFAASATGALRYASITKNGGAVWGKNSFSVLPAAQVLNIQVATDIELLATNYVELMAYSDGSAAGLNVTAATFSMVLVAPE